ncbi:MAG TPA: cupin domain-containing protein [Candidatus Eremiobacteraceae bacterium]|nr:cupin domain-containing protein [Candidatus Eremiobacteraceae bacterium]
MKCFASLEEVPPVQREREHDGFGPIVFRRMLSSDSFETNIDFVDVTTIPPGSVIGRHQHRGNEELYYIAAGDPLVRVDGDERRLHRGAIAVVHSEGWHELVNDTEQPVEIFVIQVHL